MKKWIVLAVIAVIVFIAWPKAEEKPAPIIPEHETIFSVIGEGAKDGIKDFVRHDLRKKQR